MIPQKTNNRFSFFAITNKKETNKIFALLIAACLLMTTTACRDKEDPPPPPIDPCTIIEPVEITDSKMKQEIDAYFASISSRRISKGESKLVTFIINSFDEALNIVFSEGSSYMSAFEFMD